jgi:hypothetical protein
MNECGSRHAIVLAKWEKNSKAWLDGRFFELRSGKPWLQETIGNGGTLWIVVSRPSSRGRLYTVSFRLNNCRPHTYPQAGEFGKFAVIGDDRSTFFAALDARLLLLALRFEPVLPINGPLDSQISNSIRVPRCLGIPDITLLKEHAARADRWSVFMSYRRSEHATLANDLSDRLQQEGVSVFRDLEGLRGGDRWWPELQRAITRSHRLVVLVGSTTHESKWVRKEVQHALDKNIRVVPVLAGGRFADWGPLGRALSSRHALDMEDGLDKVTDALR